VFRIIVPLQDPISVFICLKSLLAGLGHVHQIYTSSMSVLDVHRYYSQSFTVLAGHFFIRQGLLYH